MKASQMHTQQEKVSYDAEMATSSDGAVVLGENFQFDMMNLGDVGPSSVVDVGTSSGATGF